MWEKGRGKEKKVMFINYQICARHCVRFFIVFSISEKRTAFEPRRYYKKHVAKSNIRVRFRLLSIDKKIR